MDPYRVLGIPPTSTKEEVKAAFRKAALIHHPDRHANSSEPVKKQAEATFRALNEAYQNINDGNYRYKQSASPGRAGFNRGSGNPYSSYGRYGYEGGSSYYTYGSNPRPSGGGFSFTFSFDSRRFARNFVGSGSMMITAVLAGLALAGVLIMEPIMGSLWEDRNRGKLFRHIEEDVLQRQRAQQEARRAAREASRVKLASPAPDGAGFAAAGVSSDGGMGGGEGVMLPPPPVSFASLTRAQSNNSSRNNDEPPAIPP